MSSKLLIEANAQLGPYFYWGSRQKNPFDATLIPVQDDLGNGSIPLMARDRWLIETPFPEP